MPRERHATAAGMLHLLLAALVLGSAANTLGPRRIPWLRAPDDDGAAAVEAAGLRAVGPAGMRRAVAKGTAVVIDARAAPAFRRGRVPGAVSLPAARVDAELRHVEPLLAPGQEIIVYCDGPTCDDALRLALHLQRLGYTNTAVFAGGLRAWRRAGGRIERPERSGP